ncbi:hypothetical protein AAVH_28274 [Aphelenchoides avenae]|nr:hypothetical protein AAVH_28274 [Aphelenchus avenae]
MRLLFLFYLTSIAVDGAALKAKSAESESLDTFIPPITSKSSPTLADLLDPTTSKPTAAKEQQIVEFFARHIEEVANISSRLAELEGVVFLQADLIAMHKESTQLWTQYLPWKASVAAQNETLRAVGYLVERQLKDFHADVEFAKADFEAAVEEHAQCGELSGVHWKTVCDALERNVAKASAKLQRANDRARSWQETASIVRRQKAVLDSVDTAQVSNHP